MKCPTCGWDKQAGGSAKTRKGFAVTGPSVADRKKAAQTRARNAGKPFYCGVLDCSKYGYCKRYHRALRPCGRANPKFGDYDMTNAAIAERRANAHALAEERSDDSQQRVVGLPNGGGK